MGRVIGENTVCLRGEDGITQSFLPGTSESEVPEWAAAKMGDHCWADTQAVPVVDDAKSVSGGGPDGPPPQAGPSGTRDLWAAYAQSKDVAVPDDYRRSQIIEACKNAGVSVE